MKKSIFILFILLFVLAACSSEPYKQNEPEPVEQNIEPDEPDGPDTIDEPGSEIIESEIFEAYFREWSITIPYQDVSKSETYRLLYNLIIHLYKNEIFTPNTTFSNLNEYLRNSIEAVTFFEREECVSVLISTYLTSLKTERRYPMNNSWSENDWLYFFDQFLVSEVCASKMNITEKVQFTVLALERYKREPLQWTAISTMLISIMSTSDYPPFVNEVKPMLRETNWGAGYNLVTNDGDELSRDILNNFIVKYARQFLNDNGYYQDLSYWETCDFLEAVIDYIDKNQVRLISYSSSNLNYPSVTKFNEYFRNSKEAVALFEREDCVPVLISIYQDFLDTKRYLTIDSQWWNNRFFTFLELVLSSDLCMSKMNLTEKVQLMVLVLERIERHFYGQWQFNIAISIMLSSNYSPFVNEVKPILRESSMGAVYGLVANDGRPLTADQSINLIARYIKQFLSDNK